MRILSRKYSKPPIVFNNLSSTLRVINHNVCDIKVRMKQYTWPNDNVLIEMYIDDYMQHNRDGLRYWQ